MADERTWHSVALSFQPTLTVEHAGWQNFSFFFFLASLDDVLAWKPLSYLIHSPPTNTLLQTKWKIIHFPTEEVLTVLFIRQLRQ